MLGPNGRVVGTTLTDPHTIEEQLVAALAGRDPADQLVAHGSAADMYQRWVRAIPPAADATVAADGYALTLDRPVELRDVVLDADGRITDLTECVDGSCRRVSQVVIRPTMCGSYTCGTVFSSSARFPVALVATLYVRPETPIQLFELQAGQPLSAVDDAGGVVWFDADAQRLVITLPRHPGPGTQTVIAMTMASGATDYASIVYS